MKNRSRSRSLNKKTTNNTDDLVTQPTPKLKVQPTREEVAFVHSRNLAIFPNAPRIRQTPSQIAANQTSKTKTEAETKRQADDAMNSDISNIVYLPIVADAVTSEPSNSSRVDNDAPSNHDSGSPHDSGSSSSYDHDSGSSSSYDSGGSDSSFSNSGGDF